MRAIGRKSIFVIFAISILLGILLPSIVRAKFIPLQNSGYDPGEILSSAVKKCRDKADCYNQEFREIAKKYDYEIAFGVLEKLVREKPQFSYCHFMAHSIGHGAYEKNPEKWNTTLNKVPKECSYGAAHGLLEQYAASLREKNQSLISKKIISEICKGQRTSCGHILGHVLLVETEADVPQAIMACGALEGEYNRWCIHGIFMEHVYPTTLVQHGLVEQSRLETSGRLTEFSAFCNSFKEEKTNSTCWGEISRGAISEYGDNWDNILGFCDTAPLVESIKTCKDRVVESLVVSRNFEIMPLKPLCRAEDIEFEKTCYIKLIGGKMDNDIIIEDDKAVKFCLSLGSGFQQPCFRQIGQSLMNRKIESNIVDVVCKYAPVEYQNDCRRGYQS